MIEINLIPDVKQELIRAQRVRLTVISMAFLVGIASVAIVVLLGIWVVAVQGARGFISDGAIRDQQKKLESVSDIENTLTIQNQLAKLPELHDSKNIDSRIFDILSTINPSDPNRIAITNLILNSAEKTIKLEAQAANSYQALEVFKKTIEATQLQFVGEDGKTQSVPLASQISDSERSFGQDTAGVKVLRFALTFTYADELFSRTVKDARIVAPERTNATDSFLGVPQSLFTERANTSTEAN